MHRWPHPPFRWAGIEPDERNVSSAICCRATALLLIDERKVSLSKPLITSRKVFIFHCHKITSVNCNKNCRCFCRSLIRLKTKLNVPLFVQMTSLSALATSEKNKFTLSVSLVTRSYNSMCACSKDASADPAYSLLASAIHSKNVRSFTFFMNTFLKGYPH